MPVHTSLRSSSICGGREDIPLRLIAGADVHIDLIAGLRSGRLPLIAGARYEQKRS
jgi:hypothetical protein